MARPKKQNTNQVASALDDLEGGPSEPQAPEEVTIVEPEPQGVAGFTQGADPETPVPDLSNVKAEEVPVVEAVVAPDPEPEPEVFHNWSPISTVSRNGFPVKLTDDVKKPGVVAYWRKSRAFANSTHRWEQTGFWTNMATGVKIDFTPLWWKDRNAQ